MANTRQALDILRSDSKELPAILAEATALREKYFGNKVQLCSIINAKSGSCSEDCAYCAQSVHHDTDTNVFSLRSPDEIAGARNESARHPVGHFGIVTSGPTVGSDDLAVIRGVMAAHPAGSAAWCASLGALTEEQLLALKEAGLRRFHHNLETARSFFPSICTTHTYDERLATIRAARKVGLEVCSGGILGMGESLEQRVELAETLAEEEVDAIPLNFLVPIAGTPLEATLPMAPLDILRAIAMFRLMNPRAEIKVCAGRAQLRDLQAMIFFAGATGMMIGPLLTIAGCDVERDLQMIRDLGLEPDLP